MWLLKVISTVLQNGHQMEHNWFMKGRKKVIFNFIYTPCLHAVIFSWHLDVLILKNLTGRQTGNKLFSPQKRKMFQNFTIFHLLEAAPFVSLRLLPTSPKQILSGVNSLIYRTINKCSVLIWKKLLQLFQHSRSHGSWQ